MEVVDSSLFICTQISSLIFLWVHSLIFMVPLHVMSLKIHSCWPYFDFRDYLNHRKAWKTRNFMDKTHKELSTIYAVFGYHAPDQNILIAFLWMYMINNVIWLSNSVFRRWGLLFCSPLILPLERGRSVLRVAESIRVNYSRGRSSG